MENRLCLCCGEEMDNWTSSERYCDDCNERFAKMRAWQAHGISPFQGAILEARERMGRINNPPFERRSL